MARSVLHVTNDMAAASGVGTFVRRSVQSLREQGVTCAMATVADWRVQLASLRPDVVHLHALWTPGLHACSRAAHRLGLPVVWSTHGMTAPWAMAYRRWKKLPAWLLYQRRDLAEAEALHCTTALEEAWNARLGFSRTFVAPLGTDLPAEIAPPPASAGRPMEVLFVGRIHPVKGLDNLIRAAARLEGADVRFTAVGPDQDGYAARLKALASALGVASRFVFAGPLFAERLEAAYAACDVLVLPSHTENFGGVVIDALAHGRPVIAARTTPWQILAEEPRCGWWVSNAPETLADCLRARYDDFRAGRLGAYGANGRRLVAARYTWPAVARALAASYEQLGRKG